MKSAITIFALMLLAPGVCMSQPLPPDNPGKGYLEELNYIGNIQHGSSNPVYISQMPHSYASFSASYGNEKGKFRHPDDAMRVRNWNGDIYGILKMEKIAFEGSITYDNDKYFDKKWSSRLFIPRDNPFFLGDMIPTDYQSQKFRLKGGFSYTLSPKFSAGAMADYSVGVLADQLDPRGESKGIDFRVNPGVQYTTGNFAAGLSATVGKRDEYHQFMKKGHITSSDYLYFFKGFVNPEMQSVTPMTWPKMEYTDFIYGGALQLCWDNKGKTADFLEIKYTRTAGESEDATDYVRKRSGDYNVKGYGVSNRLRIRGDRAVHNISLYVNNESGDGISYVLEFRNDDQGQPEWAILSKSVTYTRKSLDGELSYRLDLMKAGVPGFTASVAGAYNDTRVTHYPEGYFQKYSSASLSLDITKYFSVGDNILMIGLKGHYRKNLSQSSDIQGVTAERAKEYFDNELEYFTADRYSLLARAGYHHSLSISGNNVTAGIFAEYGLCKYTGNGSVFSSTDRQKFRAGLSLMF